jgi:hypothetical protein
MCWTCSVSYNELAESQLCIVAPLPSSFQSAMGLSRKLGGGGGGSRGASLECPRHVTYTWSTQAYTVREILQQFQLPCVVRCAGDPGTTTVQWNSTSTSSPSSSSSSSSSSHDFAFDLRQPLLLYAARTVRKVHARSLKAADLTGQGMGQGQPLSAGELLQEFGPPLAIPEDYDGKIGLGVLFCVCLYFTHW